jgi:hypothetical protein
MLLHYILLQVLLHDQLLRQAWLLPLLLLLLL